MTLCTGVYKDLKNSKMSMNQIVLIMIPGREGREGGVSTNYLDLLPVYKRGMSITATR